MKWRNLFDFLIFKFYQKCSKIEKKLQKMSKRSQNLAKLKILIPTVSKTKEEKVISTYFFPLI